MRNVAHGRLVSYENAIITPISAPLSFASIQGYGAFRKLKFDDEEVENEKDRIYEEIKSELLKWEEPVFAVQTLKEVQEDYEKHPEIKYISRNGIKIDEKK